MISEDHLEQLCLTWVQVSDWEYRHGPDLAQDDDTPKRERNQSAIIG